jgi:putative SbcD/Mre11-related phosphoesterase
MLPQSVCNGTWKGLLISGYGALISSDKPYFMELHRNGVMAGGSYFIISDLHIGIDNHFSLIGYDAFVRSASETCEWLLQCIRHIKKRKGFDFLIVNGDMIDEYSLQRPTRDTITRFIDTLSSLSPVIIVRGNHDVMIGTLRVPDNIIIADYAIVDGILVAHGDRSLKALNISDDQQRQIEGVILAHEHPAIVISDGIRKEKAKACLISCANNIIPHKTVSTIVLPSSNPDIEGSDIAMGFMSPLLQKMPASSTHIFIVEEDSTLYFGTLTDYRKSYITFK